MHARHQNTTSKTILIIFLSLFFTGKSYSDCKLNYNTIIVAETAKECGIKIEKLNTNECNTQLSDIDISEHVFSQCVKRVMNKKLDIFLNSIKTENPILFKEQMQAQKYFNKGISNNCSKYENCMGSTYQGMKNQCYISFYEYRIAQIENIDKKKFYTQKVKTKNGFKIDFGIFNEYVLNTCKIPEDNGAGFENNVCNID
jgi:hypothetical protein